MKIIIVQGPTASGKSAMALDLARSHNGVIINADSMQLYKGLPILSAQPSEMEQSLVAHRLYGVLNPCEHGSVNRWIHMVDDVIKQEQSSFDTAIVVGGTGFYIKGLLEGLSPIPDISSSEREKIQKIADEKGTGAIFSWLQSIDPLMAGTLKPTDTHRIIRALEVMLFTKKSLSEWQKERSHKTILNGAHVQHKIIMPDREQLYKSINGRVIKMFEQGAIEEVKNLLDKHGKNLGGICKTLGFNEIQEFLGQKISLEEAIERIQQKSRQYAKRQMTWLRHQVKVTPKII